MIFSRQRRPPCLKWKEGHKRPHDPLRLFPGMWLHGLGVSMGLLWTSTGIAQSDDPDDGSAPLTYTVNASHRTEPSAGGILTADRFLTGTTNTPITWVARPLCSNFTATTRDVWYRLPVPGTGNYRFRVSMVAPSTGTAITQGGLAAYVAPNASGPFELIDCSVGGVITAASMPVLEINCIPPGSNVYIRAWDRQTHASTRGFRLYVHGQDWNDLPVPTGSRIPIADTPCDVASVPTSQLTIGGALTSFYNNFACTEAFPLDPSCGGYRTGDVWFRATVPASGSVQLYTRLGLSSLRYIRQLGLSMYTAGASCSDLSQFREVACRNLDLSANAEELVAEVCCLVPGSYIWIRAYSTLAAQTLGARYGEFQLRVASGASCAVAPPPNNDPCSATPLTFGTCPVDYADFAGAGWNSGACTTRGIPTPGCGAFNTSTRDVWYRFTAPANGIVELRVNGNTSTNPAFNPAMALYGTDGEPCNGPMSLIECDADHGTGQGAYIVRTGLIPGQTYYLRVWGQGTSGTQEGIFFVCARNPEPTLGYCFYVMTLSYDATNGTGYQTIQRIIGTDTLTFVTTNNEPNQVFLIEVPIGSTVTFRYPPRCPPACSPPWHAMSGGIWYNVSAGQLGEMPSWRLSEGGPVLGPCVQPPESYTVVACLPVQDEREDCLGSRTICGTTTVSDTTFLNDPGSYNGYTPDLTSHNRGCLDVEQLAGRWFVFRAQGTGQVSLTISGQSATDDLDFAIWDTGAQPTGPLPVVTPSVCAPNHAPIRCSRARQNAATGLRSGIVNRTTEGAGGYGWLTPLDVVQDHIYLLYVVNNNMSVPGAPHPRPCQAAPESRRFSVVWDELVNSVGAPDNSILDCTPLILPMKLLHFEAKRAGEEVRLHWATGSEKESDHFVVERSTDGVEYHGIGRVSAMGFSVLRHDYHLIDPVPFPGLNYYRLRMVDTDDSFEYSDVQVVSMGSPTRMVLFPNPTNSQLHITLEKMLEGPLVLDVFDATGRIVLQQGLNVADTHQATLDVSVLAQGSYMLRLSGLGGIISSGHFMKR